MFRYQSDSGRLALWAALPMARTAQIESRLKMILKPQQNRRALTRRAVSVSLIAAALGAGTLAALQPEAWAQGQSVAAPPITWKRTLPNGATVEVLGVSNMPTKQNGRGWWKPEGTPLAGSPFGPPMDIAVEGRNRRAFALRVRPPFNGSPGYPYDYIAMYDVPGATSQATALGIASSYAPRLPGLDVVSAGADTLPPLSTVRCGVAAGPWETLTSQYVIPGSAAIKSVNLPYQHTQMDVIFSRTSEVNGNVAVTITTTLPDTLATWRVLAVDTAGKVYSSGDGGRLGGKVQQETCVFAGLPRKRVRAFQFQVRPYEWAEFTGIALRPRAGGMNPPAAKADALAGYRQR